MTKLSEPSRGTAPSISARRERILDAAGQVFVTLGYEASVDTIAAQAGVSKQTLYNQFGSKEELFRALISSRAAVIRASLLDTSHAQPPYDVLMKFTRDYYNLAMTETGTAFMRMIISVAQRFPEIARDYYELGPGETLQALTQWIAGEVRLGRLKVDEPRLAAEHYLSMMFGHLQWKSFLGLGKALTEREIERRATFCADTFMRAFGR